MEIRHYRQGDEHGIIDLMLKVFGVRMAPDLWKWKFFDSPFGSPVIVVCEMHGRIIGHSAAVPRRLFVNGNSVPAFLGVDSMVDPDHRGAGIFIDIQNELSRTLPETAGKFIFSFANAASRNILAKRGIRKYLGELRSLTRVIKPGRFVINRIRNKFMKGSPIANLGSDYKLPPFETTLGKGLTLENVSRFSGELENLWHSTCSLQNISVDRNDDYLNWRYIDHPKKAYTPAIVKREGETVGFIVLGTLELPFRKGVIMDCHFREDDRGALVKTCEYVTRYFKHTGLESVSTWTSGSTAMASALKSLGFLGRSAEVYLMVRTTERELEPVFNNMDNWDYSYGDSDIA